MICVKSEPRVTCQLILTHQGGKTDARGADPSELSFRRGRDRGELAARLDDFDQLSPRKLFRRVDPQVTQTYQELFEWLEPEQLLTAPPTGWGRDWREADADSFEPASHLGRAEERPAMSRGDD